MHPPYAPPQSTVTAQPPHDTPTHLREGREVGAERASRGLLSNIVQNRRIAHPPFGFAPSLLQPFSRIKKYNHFVSYVVSQARRTRSKNPYTCSNVCLPGHTLHYACVLVCCVQYLVKQGKWRYTPYILLPVITLKPIAQSCHI